MADPTPASHESFTQLDYCDRSAQAQTDVWSSILLSLQPVFDAILKSGTEPNATLDGWTLGGTTWRILKSGTYLQIERYTGGDWKREAFFDSAGNLHLENRANSDRVLYIDSGDSAAYASSIVFADRGNAAWQLSKTNDNSFRLRNIIEGMTPIKVEYGTGNNYAVVITDDGIVSLGSTSPPGGVRLYVSGNLRADGDGLFKNTAGPAAVEIDALGTYANEPALVFRKNGTETWRVLTTYDHQVRIRQGSTDAVVLASGTPANSLVTTPTTVGVRTTIVPNDVAFYVSGASRFNGNVQTGAIQSSSTVSSRGLTVTGTGLFTSTVTGVTPTDPYHFTTKDYVDSHNKAIVAGANVTVTSGSNTITVASTGGTSHAIVGDGGFIAVATGTNSIRVVADAIVSSDSNLTVTSGSNTVSFDFSNSPTFTAITASSVSGTATGVFGDAGSEGDGVNINGTIYESALKASDIGSVKEALFQIHRHSTTREPIFLSSRSNSDTSSHSNVTTGQSVLGIVGAGWTGSHYDVAGRMDIKVDSGTVSSSSMPGKIEFRVNDNGAAAVNPTLRAAISGGGMGVTNNFTVGGDTNLNTLTADTIAALSSLTISGVPVPLTGGGGVTDHGALTGLADDDHPQYLTTARADNRYLYKALLGGNNITVTSGSNNVTVAATGVITSYPSADQTIMKHLGIGAAPGAGTSNAPLLVSQEASGSPILDMKYAGVPARMRWMFGTTSIFEFGVNAAGDFSLLGYLGLYEPLKVSAFAATDSLVIPPGGNVGIGASPTSGTLHVFGTGYFNNGLTVSGLPVYADRELGRYTTPLLVNNSSDVTTIYSTSVPGGWLQNGRVLELHTGGTYYNNSGTSKTLTLNVDFGGAALYTDATGNITTSAVRRVWTLDLYLSGMQDQSYFLRGIFSVGSATNASTGVGGLDTTSTFICPVVASGTSASLGSAQTFTVSLKNNTAASTIEFERHFAFAKVI